MPKYAKTDRHTETDRQTDRQADRRKSPNQYLANIHTRIKDTNIYGLSIDWM